MSLQETPSANRLHIAIYGRRNAGKSSLINALTRQQTALVSEIAGTTTDPVQKAMEVRGLGACVLIDTAGFDDEGELGELRIKKTKETIAKAELAVLVIAAGDADRADRKITGTSAGVSPNETFSAENEAEEAEEIEAEETEEEETEAEETGPDLSAEIQWNKELAAAGIHRVIVVNKCDLGVDELYLAQIEKKLGSRPIPVSAKTGEGMEELLEALARQIPENYGERLITGNLVKSGDVVMLVMPQDSEAPKGRLILPQVQTIRELLDRKCISINVTPDTMEAALASLKKAPDLIITDSQVFGEVYQKLPKESRLTSFSVLFAAYKGDIHAFKDGAEAIHHLTADSRILIAEACTHAPLTEDIGRVKIPAMLRKKFGQSLQIDMVSGADFPQDLTPYSLIIHCGGCMFNQKYLLSRVERARAAGVPITNYGILIAKLKGILDHVELPE